MEVRSLETPAPAIGIPTWIPMAMSILFPWTSTKAMVPITATEVPKVNRMAHKVLRTMFAVVTTTRDILNIQHHLKEAILLLRMATGHLTPRMWLDPSNMSTVHLTTSDPRPIQEGISLTFLSV